MKICFSARPAYDRLSTEIYKQLIELNKDITAIFITQNTENTIYVKGEVKGAKIYQVSDILAEHWNEFSLEKLSFYETKYDCTPIWKYIFTDRFLISFSYDYVIKITCGLFYFYENIFINEKCDFYYDETIAVLQAYIAYIVGKFHNVKYISQMAARGADSTHHYFLCDPFEYNCNFNNNYIEKPLSENEYQFADEFLQKFENKNIVPDNMIFTGSKPKIRKGFIKLPYTYLRNRFSEKYNNKFDYMNYMAYKFDFDSLKFYIKYIASKKYYHHPDYNRKYIYYPLHYQPEASTLVCAQKYEKQLFYIDSWAKSLPADTVLYVKEHYAILGHRDLEFYKQLKKYPNVILIDPWVNSRELIIHSVAVTTLTGTAGWEAMLLRKPVFLGGNIYFDNAPGIIKIKDIFDNYIEKIVNWKQPTREEVIKYLCEYFATLSKGNAYAINPICHESSNIYNLSISLLIQMKKMEETNE
jgi:hypothetical protein